METVAWLVSVTAWSLSIKRRCILMGTSRGKTWDHGRRRCLYWWTTMEGTLTEMMTKEVVIQHFIHIVSHPLCWRFSAQQQMTKWNVALPWKKSAYIPGFEHYWKHLKAHKKAKLFLDLLMGKCYISCPSKAFELNLVWSTSYSLSVSKMKIRLLELQIAKRDWVSVQKKPNKKSSILAGCLMVSNQGNNAL